MSTYVYSSRVQSFKILLLGCFLTFLMMSPVLADVSACPSVDPSTVSPAVQEPVSTATCSPQGGSPCEQPYDGCESKENSESNCQEKVNNKNTLIMIALLALAAFFLLKTLFDDDDDDSSSGGNNIVVVPGDNNDDDGGVVPGDNNDDSEYPIIKDTYPSVGNSGADQTFYTSVPGSTSTLDGTNQAIIRNPDEASPIVRNKLVANYANSDSVDEARYNQRIMATQAMAEGTAVAFSGLTAVKKLNDRNVPANAPTIPNASQQDAKSKNQRSLPEGLEMIAKAARLRLLAADQIQYATSMTGTGSEGVVSGEPFKADTSSCQKCQEAVCETCVVSNCTGDCQEKAANASVN